MNHNCPHCSTALSKRLVRSKALPGEDRWLPLRAHMVCPVCGGGLEQNLHPVEEKFHRNVIWLALPVFSGLFLKNVWLLLFGAALLTVAAGYVSWHLWKNLASWPRYKPYQEQEARKDGPNQ
jgi:hypothetical protein